MAEQAQVYDYLNQWWPSSLTHTHLGLDELITIILNDGGTVRVKESDIYYKPNRDY